MNFNLSSLNAQEAPRGVPRGENIIYTEHHYIIMYRSFHSYMLIKTIFWYECTVLYCSILYYSQLLFVVYRRERCYHLLVYYTVLYYILLLCIGVSSHVTYMPIYNIISHVTTLQITPSFLSFFLFIYYDYD